MGPSLHDRAALLEEIVARVAATVFEPSTSASANSNRVLSTASWRAQSLKLERKPWPVPLISGNPSPSATDVLERCQPCDRGTPARRRGTAPAVLQHANAPVASGTRYGRERFMCASGTVHTADWVSNSSHAGRRISTPRSAVSTPNRNAS